MQSARKKVLAVILGASVPLGTAIGHASPVTNFGENVAPITRSIKDGADIVKETVDWYWDVTYRPYNKPAGTGQRSTKTLGPGAGISRKTLQDVGEDGDIPQAIPQAPGPAVQPIAPDTQAAQAWRDVSMKVAAPGSISAPMQAITPAQSIGDPVAAGMGYKAPSPRACTACGD